MNVTEMDLDERGAEGPAYAKISLELEAVNLRLGEAELRLLECKRVVMSLEAERSEAEHEAIREAGREADRIWLIAHDARRDRKRLRIERGWVPRGTSAPFNKN